MHTVAGIPAMYHQGEQICFANGIRGSAAILSLASDLKQIKLEQKLSKKWRKKMGFTDYDHYGYVRILKSAFKY